MIIKIIHPRDTVLENNLFLKEQDLSRNIGSLGFFREFSTYEPELLALATEFKTLGHDVEYIDENLGDEINFSECDIAVLGGVTCQIKRIYELCGEFRKSGIRTVVTGQHVSLNPSEALKYSDMTVTGNFTGTASSILENINKRVIIEGENRFNFITDFSLLHNKQIEIFPLIASRGCNCNCVFCTIYSGSRKKMLRSTEILRDEIIALKKIKKDPAIIFMDDNFFADRRWVNEIVQILKELEIRYATHGDISIGEDDELLEKLKESGCTRIFMGLESADEKILKKISPWKHGYFKDYGRLTDKIQNMGIGVLYSFIIGFEGEKDIIEKIDEFIEEHPPVALSISLFTPMPGTEIYNEYRRNKKIIENDYSKYTQFYPVIDFKGRLEYLQNGIENIYRKFYSMSNTKKRINKFKKEYRGKL